MKGFLTFGPDRWWAIDQHGKTLGSFHSWTDANNWAKKNKAKLLDLGEISMRKPWYWKLFCFIAWRLHVRT